MTDYLTTKELAEMLRIKERKVYALAASGEVPCSKAMGKLLFPREAIESWLAERSSGVEHHSVRPRANVFLGSHDPLLDWALRESRCGIATFFDGSTDGLTRFANGEGVATGLHLYDSASERWNETIVAERFGAMPVVLVEWARRARGLIVKESLKKKISSIADLKGRSVSPRQPESGAQALFDQLASEAGLSEADLTLTVPARTEADAALAVLDGKADAAFGLASIAAQYRLPFVPLIEERFDLLVYRRAWFEPPMQSFLQFCRTQAFRTRAREMAGYDIADLGTVHFNGA